MKPKYLQQDPSKTKHNIHFFVIGDSRQQGAIQNICNNDKIL